MTFPLMEPGLPQDVWAVRELIIWDVCNFRFNESGELPSITNNDHQTENIDYELTLGHHLQNSKNGDSLYHTGDVRITSHLGPAK